MPKNRHRSKQSAAEKNPKNLRGNTPGAPGPARLAVVGGALLLALAMTGMLSFDALGLGQLPGCGAEGGCAQASESPLGKITFSEDYAWPVAFLGFAYFVAMSIATLLLRGRFNTPFKVIVAIGVAGSLFYTGAILLNWDKYRCWYCIFSHLGNFAFAAAVFFPGVRAQRALAPIPTFAAIAGAFVLTTGGLAGVKAFSDNQAEATIAAQSDEDTQAIINASRVTTDDDATSANTAPAVAQSDETAEDHPDLMATAYRTDDRGFTGRYRLGPREAKIRIVMFSDYGCKACRIVSSEIKELLAARDDVSYSHKHFPFDNECNPRIPARATRANACLTARVAESAGELYGPAAFWRFHFAYYEASASGERFDAIEFIDSLGLPARELVRHANNTESVELAVSDDVSEAMSLGLTRTPTVYINGVEFRGWGIRGNLTKRVGEIADQIAPATAESDTPLGAFDKYVSDFREAARPVRDLGNDAVVSYLGADEPAVEMQLFFGYESDDLAQHLLAFERVLEQFPSELRIVVRHYALSEDCNPHSERNRPNNSCVMHHALETAAIVGGNDAFQRAYRWMLDNLNTFDESRATELAATLGLDQTEFLRVLTSNTPGQHSFDDANWLHSVAKRRANAPQVFINNKRVERWVLGQDRTGVLTEIIRGELAAAP